MTLTEVKLENLKSSVMSIKFIDQNDKTFFKVVIFFIFVLDVFYLLLLLSGHEFESKSTPLNYLASIMDVLLFLWI